jgi:outer membrane protein
MHCRYDPPARLVHRGIIMICGERKMECIHRFSRGFTGVRKAPACLVRCLFAILLLSGCASIQPPILNEDLDSRVRDIELLELPDLSTEEPLPLEDAQGMRDEVMFEPAVPPERMSLDVGEVRRLALAGNLDLAVERVRPPISAELVNEEEARFEAAFFASGSLQQTEPLPERQEPAIDRTRTGMEIGVEVPLRTGGVATVRLPSTGLDLDAPGVTDQFDASVELSISQPLLRSAGVGFNEAPIMIARLQYRQDQAQAKLAAIGILASAETAYWEHYAASRVLEVRYEQYQRALTQENQAQRLADEGVVPQIEVTRASSEVALRIDDIIVAKTRRNATERNLKRIMNRPGLGMETSTTIVSSTDPNPLGLELDHAALGDLAVENRMEMLNLELQLAIDRLTIAQASNQALPDLALEYFYSRLGRNSALGNSFDRALDGDGQDWTVGLSLEVPLGNRAAEARQRRAMLQRVLTMTSQDQRRTAIRQEVYDAVDRLNQSWLQILAAREATIIAARVYEGEQRQFRAGVRTSTDVLNAADRLAEAQISEIQALASYEISKVDTAVATGTLLGKGRVHLYRDSQG